MNKCLQHKLTISQGPNQFRKQSSSQLNVSPPGLLLSQLNISARQASQECKKAESPERLLVRLYSSALPPV